MASSNINASEVEETLARIKSHKGVEGVIIMTKEGKQKYRSTFRNTFNDLAGAVTL
jgi:hypothetical protein